MPTDQVTAHNQVMSTTNYSRFGLLSANRDINRNHVNALISSMEENGNFTEAQPILVNERLEVIDGQHRLEACRSMGIPVYYTQVNGLNINQARDMNLLHRRWQAKDYLESYAEEGRRPYVELKMLQEEYPEVSISTIVVYANGWYYNGYNANFRNGTMKMFDLQAARERLDLLEELRSITATFNIKSMQFAMLTVFNTTGYDHERMKRKVTQAGPDFKPYQNISDNLRLLENVYNEGYSEGRRLRFF